MSRCCNDDRRLLRWRAEDGAAAQRFLAAREVTAAALRREFAVAG
jgi:hypothetical protein